MSEHPFEGTGDGTPDGVHTSLHREAVEAEAVVGQEQPDPKHRPSLGRCLEERHTNSMRAIGALSPWRGPSLRMRVYPPERSS